MEAKAHWEKIYRTKSLTEVSWYQSRPQISLDLIQRTGVDENAPIIDVGGGASILIDHLLDNGYRDLTVLDISFAALDLARARLGQRATMVKWIEADVTNVELRHQHYQVWHDRAVLHFLTDEGARARYVNVVRAAVRPGGHVIVATFAEDGPARCSGLEVVRYSPTRLHEVFGSDFVLEDSTREVHQTPFGTEQEFVYCHFRKA